MPVQPLCPGQIDGVHGPTTDHGCGYTLESRNLRSGKSRHPPRPHSGRCGFCDGNQRRRRARRPQAVNPGIMAAPQTGVAQLNRSTPVSARTNRLPAEQHNATGKPPAGDDRRTPSRLAPLGKADDCNQRCRVDHAVKRTDPQQFSPPSHRQLDVWRAHQPPPMKHRRAQRLPATAGSSAITIITVIRDRRSALRDAPPTATSSAAPNFSATALPSVSRTGLC
jgi:hypothetical protein